MTISVIIRGLRFQLFAALVIGGLVGWFATLTQDGAINTAQTGAQIFLALGIALPVSLVTFARLSAEPLDRRFVVGLAIAGALMGIVVYIAMVSLVTGSVGGEDLNTVRNELGARIPIWQYGVIFVVQIAVGILVPLSNKDISSE